MRLAIAIRVICYLGLEAYRAVEKDQRYPLGCRPWPRYYLKALKPDIDAVLHLSGAVVVEFYHEGVLVFILTLESVSECTMEWV